MFKELASVFFVYFAIITFQYVERTYPPKVQQVRETSRTYAGGEDVGKIVGLGLTSSSSESHSRGCFGGLGLLVELVAI